MTRNNVARSYPGCSCNSGRPVVFRAPMSYLTLGFAGTLLISIGLVGCGGSNGTSSTPQTPTVTSASLSASFFDFGNNLVNNSVSQTVATVTNTGTTDLTMSPAITGDASYTIVAAQSCGSTLAASASCKMVVTYNPTVASAPKTQDATLNMHFTGVSASTPQTVSITGTSGALSAGTVTPTANPQVALYTMTLPFPGSMTVNFGPTTSYGLTTWAQSVDTAGGQVSIFVAGMKASTAYHMAATVQFSNGITATDADHTFTTGAVPTIPDFNLTLTAATTAGLTPQPGLELLNAPGAVAISDLAGNILWMYANPGGGTSTDLIQGVKMLSNGDILMVIGANSGVPLSGPLPANSFLEIREVDLAGDTVRELSINDLNDALQSATCAECHVTLQTFHHDVTPLPDGGWLMIANTIMNLSPSTTPALTNEAPTAVLGDVIVAVDKNLRPIWVWNEFNHLDPNRHPMNFPDWTHTNAVLYSPDDGNILVSIRHQNWLVKVDYENGSGNGNILWRLGQGGDFTLAGGTDPTDWQYAQHGPSYFTQNTTGVFSLGVMDNGDDRSFPTGTQCGTAGAPSCLYSSAMVFQIDETGKTATITFHHILPDSEYISWGGNVEQMANGNVEYDLAGLGGASIINEETQDANHQTVWTMKSAYTNLYRAFRIPSPYPGVQW
jgi:arylsulfate sulfotransferase